MSETSHDFRRSFNAEVELEAGSVITTRAGFGSVPARAARSAAHSPSKLEGERIPFSLRIFCSVKEFFGEGQSTLQLRPASLLLVHSFSVFFSILYYFLFHFRTSWDSESEE
ncbi:hypothetical protein AVEN_194967-1, partial [Araneus ventricosus]